MKKIFKQELKIVDEQFITVPEGSHFLCCKEQNNKLCIWYMCKLENDMEYVKIRIIGTGNPVEDSFCEDFDTFYIDSVIMSNGFVWHVFLERGVNMNE